MKTILLAIALVVFAPWTYAETPMAPGFTQADSSGKEISLPRRHDGVDIYLFWTDSWSTYMFYAGLALMLIASIWDLISPPRKVCATPRTADASPVD